MKNPGFWGGSERWLVSCLCGLVLLDFSLYAGVGIMSTGRSTGSGDLGVGGSAASDQ